MFNYQEGRHYSNHARFNDVVRAGYPAEIGAGEQRPRADYRRFAERGHRFGLAYTEGFETVAPRLCDHLFAHAHRYGLDTGEPAAYLWLWHVAEEHEHRTVANEVYRELHGDGVEGYRYQVYGILYATWHVFAYSLPVARRTLRIARARMTRRERLRYAGLLAGLTASFIAHLLLRALRAGYDPAVLEPPPAARELLEEARARFGGVALGDSQPRVGDVQTRRVAHPSRCR